MDCISFNSDCKFDNFRLITSKCLKKISLEHKHWSPHLGWFTSTMNNVYIVQKDSLVVKISRGCNCCSCYRRIKYSPAVDTDYSWIIEFPCIFTRIGYNTPQSCSYSRRIFHSPLIATSGEYLREITNLEFEIHVNLIFSTKQFGRNIC